MVLDEAGYQAYMGGSAFTPLVSNASCGTGCSISYTDAAAVVEPVRIVLANNSASDLNVGWGRDATRFDVVADVLGSIYAELQSRGQTYSHLASGAFDGVQYIRRPSESISMMGSNCIDGSLLFASVLVSAGFEPILIVPSGHAYVGMRSHIHLQSSLIWPVETTMVATSPFGDAFAYGITEFQAEATMTSTHFVDVADVISRGIRSQPL
jgi:hypothetical protein